MLVRSGQDPTKSLGPKEKQGRSTEHRLEPVTGSGPGRTGFVADSGDSGGRESAQSGLKRERI